MNNCSTQQLLETHLQNREPVRELAHYPLILRTEMEQLDNSLWWSFQCLSDSLYKCEQLQPNNPIKTKTQHRLISTQNTIDAGEPHGQSNWDPSLQLPELRVQQTYCEQMAHATSWAQFEAANTHSPADRWKWLTLGSKLQNQLSTSTLLLTPTHSATALCRLRLF